MKNNNKNSVSYKNLDVYKVITVLFEHVQYILCEHWEGKNNKNGIILLPKKFKLYTKKIFLSYNSFVWVKSEFYCSDSTIFIFLNIATTVHKLQGMSKNIIIVSDWD